MNSEDYARRIKQRQQHMAQEELAQEIATVRELQESVPRLLQAFRANLPALVEGAEKYITLLTHLRRREEATGLFRLTKRVIEEERHWAGWRLAAWKFSMHVPFGGGDIA